MALWGKSDNLSLPGAPTSVDVVGTASSEFWTIEGADLESTVPVGTTVVLGLQGVGGFLTIESYLSPTLARVGKMSGVNTGTITPVAYSEQPISLKNDPGFAPASPDGELDRSQRPVGVNTLGLDAAAAAGQGGIHAGWVGVTTYVDMHGFVRTKSETYVAMSGITTGSRDYPRS